MLLKIITFDEKAYAWTNNRESNIMFLGVAERHTNEIIRHRGYMYLNQICEQLGVEWNPEDDNPCIRNDGANRLAFVQFEIFNKPNNSLLVHIHRYD